MKYIDNALQINVIGWLPRGSAKSTTSFNVERVAEPVLAFLSLVKFISITPLMALFTRKVVNKIPQEERDELIAAIKSVAGDAINEIELGKIADYMDKQIGLSRPDKYNIDAQRYKKRKDQGAIHRLTPLAIADGKRIDGLLIHLDEIGNGTFSIVKLGITLSKTGNHWSARKVAIHKEKKLIADEETYKNDILMHQKLFGLDRHENVDNGPLLYGQLSSDRAFMLHDLAQSDLSHYQILSSQKLFQLANDIAQGLDFYHQHKVLFCDLKPDNILISKEGRAILSDPQEQLEGAVKGVKGTPACHPAEIGRTEVKQNRSWDLYALGVVLLEMKYNYLSNEVNKLTSTKRKEYLQNKMKSNIGKDIKKAVEDSAAFTSIMAVKVIHNCHLERIISVSDQNKLLDEIFGSDQNLLELKKQLAKYDEIVAGLISLDPSERPEARQVIKALTFE